MSASIGKRRRPTPFPQPAYAYDAGKYPVHVRISFSDGRTKVYDEHNIQPEPTFFSDSDIKRMNRNPEGYRFKERGLTAWERLLNRITDFLFPILRK
jgi:hypothetical protein